MIYYFTYFLTKFVLSALYFPRTVYGIDHIPPQGGCIIASNHVSNLDPVVLGISCGRRINFMAKFELFQKQPLGFFLTKLGAFPVKRNEADFGALREAVKRLRKGKPVLIFVEGTRRIGDTPAKAQAGVGFLAMKTNVPVIPVFVKGTQKVMPPGSKFFNRHPVTVRFGPAVSYDANSSYQSTADAILKSIYASR